jgi:hypothetical protein
MGKTASTVRTDVSSIVWNSQYSDAKARDTGVDVAVLRLSRPLADRPSVSGFALGSSAQINDDVYTVGFPGASGNVVTSGKYVPTMKRGIVSKLGGEHPDISEAARNRGEGRGVIETDAAINPGNSGGPVQRMAKSWASTPSFLREAPASAGHRTSRWSCPS